jgi:superfamily I DNA/RNA helicase/mRNA-degrading endonuclease YafQ of YafQ-DinJ toxin-antitoxin module
MLIDVLTSDSFDQSLSRLPLPMRETVRRKIHLLAENPGHPSLNTHRLHNVKANIWDCYVSESMRLLYEIRDGNLQLWNVGPHSMVDNVRLRGFAANTRFSRMEQASEAIPLPPRDKPEKPAFDPSLFRDAGFVPVTPEMMQKGTPNAFAFFQDAHLRILGVPSSLVKLLKRASSLEAALELPQLPEQTRMWLEELSTSTELEEVMFDSSRLLYRSTLDRFDGYCEGKIKRLMLNLQRPEQQQYVEMERAPLILLKGAAGSGKTTVGIYRAIRLAEQGRSVLVLTYNRTLSSITKALIEELIGPLPKNLQVMTLHSLMGHLLHGRSIELHIADDGKTRKVLYDALQEVRLKDSAVVLKRDQAFFEEEIKRVIKGLGLKNVEEYKAVERYGRKTALSGKQREAVWKVYEAYQRRMLHAKYHDWADHAAKALEALQSQAIANGFDDIIVDEAQDLRPVDLRVIQQFIALPSEGPAGMVRSIMILADAAQTLYSRGFSWKQAGIQARGRTVILRKNYRNTRQVAEAAAHLLQRNELMRATQEYVDPEWTQRQGPYPVVLKATNAFGQLELVRERILDLVSDQAFRLSDFAVLCPTNQLCEQCQRELDHAGLRTVLHKDSDFDLLEERIKILTIHSAKGLEFPVVFLVGLMVGVLPSSQGLQHSEAEEAQLYIEQQRTLCYVGMTRAAEALYLLTVRGAESRFIKELTGKVVIWE